MRMTEENWRRFGVPNVVTTLMKKTTIRMKPIRPGLHKVLGGPRFKPKRLGILRIGFHHSKKVKELTNEDAWNDGFDTWLQLIIELAHRNPKLTADSIAFIHPAEVIENYLPMTVVIDR